MPDPISFGKIETHLVSTLEGTRGAPEPETPFRILIMGDFSGRSNRGIVSPGKALTYQGPVPVDRDNLDEVLEKMGVEILLPIFGENTSPVSIRFSELEDFHPDRLYERLDVFQDLKETLENLEDPSALAAAANESQGGDPEVSGVGIDHQGKIPSGTDGKATGGLL